VVLIAQQRYSAALAGLRAIVARRPDLASVQYQIGALLARTGRFDEAAKAFDEAAALRPDDPQVPIALASTMLRARHLDEAGAHADRAVEMADAGTDAWMKAAAHDIAARVALAREDAGAASAHALAAQKADPLLPLTQFVRGRLLYDDAKYEEALAAFGETKRALKPQSAPLVELHLYLGNSLARMDRYAEAEAEFHEELREFPQNIGTYASLAMLYRASNRNQAVEQIIGDLVEAAPTPEGYAMAARLFTIVGDTARADALRSDARRRFRGDPSLALLGRSR
jgi:tetratricopeptide (TPR) repeat protein